MTKRQAILMNVYDFYLGTWRPQALCHSWILMIYVSQPLCQFTKMSRMKQTVPPRSSSPWGPASCSVTSRTATTHCCHLAVPSSAKARDSTWTLNRPPLHPVLSSSWCKGILFCPYPNFIQFFKYYINKLAIKCISEVLLTCLSQVQLQELEINGENQQEMVTKNRSSRGLHTWIFGWNIFRDLHKVRGNE